MICVLQAFCRALKDRPGSGLKFRKLCVSFSGVTLYDLWIAVALVSFKGDRQSIGEGRYHKLEEINKFTLSTCRIGFRGIERQS